MSTERTTELSSESSKHPAQYSPEVLDVIARHLRPGDHMFDPFAGTGHRLASLCDELRLEFSGADIEDWPGHDVWVICADAADSTTYPRAPFVICCSPVYVHKRLADYPNGPTPFTKTKGRRDYGIALGRPLHPDNFARSTGRPAQAERYWQDHSEAVKHWGSASS